MIDAEELLSIATRRAEKDLAEINRLQRLRDRLSVLLDEATKLGARMASLECESTAEDRFAAIRKEAGLDA